MRYVAFLFYVTVLVIMASVVGCGTDNPICTDSFCLVPRDDVSGDVIVIDDAKVLALIDSLAVDTGTTAEIEQQTEATDVTVTDIILDVATGSTAYLNQTVTIDGVVAWKDANSTGLVIYTTANAVEAQSQGAVFFISFIKRADFNRFALSSSYTFTVKIVQIKPPTDTLLFYSIFSDFLE